MDDAVKVYNAAGLGEAVRHFRTLAGWSQVELARRAGVSRDAVVKLENGRATEQLQHLVRLLEAAGARITVAKADW